MISVVNEVSFAQHAPNDTANAPINDTVKQRYKAIVKLLLQSPGLKSGQIAKKIGISEVSIRRDMQILKPIITFQGSPKSGGYYLSEEIKNKLSK